MDINLLVLFFLVIGLLYALSLLVLAYFSPENQEEELSEVVPIPVTLLIPFRNERENLPGLLDTVEKLTYPALEVIWIDDHSEDGGHAYLKERINKENRVDSQVVLSPGEGKKAALEYGISLSRGKLILTTDADCTFPPDWVRWMVEPFADASVQMVGGPVMVDCRKNWFGYFQQIEWSSILLVTRFFFRIKRPIMCSAANMAYRKEAFQHLNGYQGNDSCLTGDDVFLLEKMVRHFGPASVQYISDKKALVWTAAAKSWKVLLQQRVRWASKWNRHRLAANVTTALLSFGWALICGCSLFLLLLEPSYPYAFIFFWMVKTGVEMTVLGRILKQYEINVPWLSFVYTGMVHPFYVLLVGLGAIRGKFTWKGRESFTKA